MANTDTGLGWSADGGYLIDNGPQYFGQLVASDYHPNTNVFPSRPSISDVVNGGATFYSNGVPYYIAVWCSDEDGYSGSLELAVYSPNGRTVCMALICDVEFYMYYPRLYITDGTREFSGNWNVGVRGLVDADTGLYVAHRDNIFWDFGVTWGTLTPGTAKVGSSLQDVLNQFQPTVTNIYKLNRGYAVACFAKWKDFAPATYWTPFLISTDENAIKFSTDGTTEYPYATKAIQRYDGMTFYVSYIRGVDGDPNTAYPTFDANAEFIGPGGDMLSLNNVFAMIASSEHANILVNETDEPYDDIDPSGEGGGEGENDGDDDIEDSPLPIFSFADSGFCRIYRSDLVSLQHLAQYMWTDTTFLDTLRNKLLQVFEDPMKAIITLNMLPVNLTGYYGAAEGVSVMYIPTGVAMWPMTTQFIPVDCGTVTLHERFGSVMDYNPYTKISLFLPYIGTVDLDTDEVMGKTISVKYKIDVVSGICVAVVRANNDVRYQFTGHCAIPMPLSSSDFTGYLQAALQLGGVIAGAAMAAGAPTSGGSIFSPPLEGGGGGSLTKTTISARNQDTGRFKQAVKKNTETTYKPHEVSYGELLKRDTPNVIGAVVNSKLGVEHSGGFNGNSGYLGVRRPFLTIKRPNACRPLNYGQLNGRPSMMYLNLGQCTGYTEVQSVQLTGFKATNPEMSEIATLLKSGVIF